MRKLKVFFVCCLLGGLIVSCFNPVGIIMFITGFGGWILLELL